MLYIYIYVWMPEWFKGVDSSSTVERLVGSNPTPYILISYK